MSFCAPGERFGALSVTPVENLFIDEYMLRAPGDFVRVYLYGLRLCFHPENSCTPESMARALGMTREAVLDAFTYWERQGVVRLAGDNPFRVEYVHLVDALFSREKAGGEVYRYQDFNQDLQQLFGDKLLHPQDYARAYDWIEVLGLRPEVVLLMVQSTMEERRRTGARDKKVSTAYLDKVAKTWAERALTTLPAARAYLAEHSPGMEGAERILRRLGLHRPPTAEEAKMYARWTDDLGFSHEAVEAALPSMSGLRNPTMKQLDERVQWLAGQNARTPKAAQDAFARMEAVRALLCALGDAYARPTDDMLAQYGRWLAEGFTHEALLGAAPLAKAEGGRTFTDFQSVLSWYRDQGAFTAPAMAQLRARRTESDRPVKELLEAMGLKRPVNDTDRGLYSTWRAQGFPAEVLLYAAQTAASARSPMPYLQRILSSWAASGVRTLEAAQNANGGASAVSPAPASASKAPAVARPGKEVAEHRYQQRSYTDEELNRMLILPPLAEDE